MDRSEPWSATADGLARPDGAWAVLTGGAGGAAVPAATAQGNGKSLLQRAHAASRRTRQTEARNTTARIGNPVPPANTTPATPLAGTVRPWLARWLGCDKSAINDWRIRL